MVSEDPFDKGGGLGPEQDCASLIRLGLEQTPDEFVDRDVLVFLVRLDMHVVEPTTRGGTPSDRAMRCTGPSGPPSSFRSSPGARPGRPGGGDGDRTSR